MTTDGGGTAMLWALARVTQTGDDIALRFESFMLAAHEQGPSEAAVRAWSILTTLHCHAHHSAECPVRPTADAVFGKIAETMVWDALNWIDGSAR